MGELMALYHSKSDAAAAYSAALSEVAEKAAVDKKVLRRLVKARIDNKEEEEKSEAETLAALIEQVAS